MRDPDRETGSTMSPLRLGYFYPNRHLGGVGRYVNALIRAVADSGAVVHAFVPEHHTLMIPPGVTEHIIEPGSPSNATPGHDSGESSTGPVRPGLLSRIWRKLSSDRFRHSVGLYRSGRRLGKRLESAARGLDLDVIHTQVGGVDDTSNLSASFARCGAVVSTLHVDSTYAPAGKPEPFLVRRFSDRAVDRYIAVSHATKQDWTTQLGVDANRIDVVHNGVSVPSGEVDGGLFADRIPHPNPLVFGMGGRLSPQKGYDIAIRALKPIMAEREDAFAVVVGHGPDEEMLRELAVQLGIGERVLFVERLEEHEMPSFFQSVDVVLMPSRCECLPFTLLDALANGRPAVVSNVGGMPEVVCDEVGAVCQKDDVGAFSAALRRLSDESTRKACSLAAKERVKLFAEDTMVRETIDVYESVVRSKARRKSRSKGGDS